MNHTCLESDWKRFREMLPVWRDRYLATRNLAITRLLSEQGKTETEKFWDAEELIKKEAKILARCLGHVSRAQMGLILLQMRGAGMITEADLADFSEDLRRRIFSEFQ